MVKRPARNRQSSRTKLDDANIPIPDLTNDVKAFIANLGDSPREQYLKEQAWSKFVSKETDPPALRKSRAIEKWLAAESRNAETNVRLAFTDEEFHILPHVSYRQFMAFLTSLIESIVGAVPPPEVLLGGFSGGATTSRKRTDSQPAEKFTGQAHISTRARGLSRQVIEMAPRWFLYVGPGEYLVTHEVNHMFTVPKNTTIDRVACKEPDVNMFLQKGLGNEIRRALRRVGVNLNDQTFNQRLARKGSIDGSLATVDLSSASDSITWELVFQAMPSCWFTLLDSTRSEVTVIGDEEHVNEMFSSMGNGFTFELESLLFYAIARTVCYFRGYKGIVSVYGDDIIIPSDAFDDLEWTLGYLGFSLNREKSFATGPFRESCGGHYYNGVDITPFYIRRPLDRLTEVILLANNVRKFAGLDGCGVLDPTLLPLWEYLVLHIPDELGGGHELGSKFQLVDAREPAMVLKPVTKSKDYGIGGYLHWLCTTWKRDNQPVVRLAPDYSLKLSTSRDPSRPDYLTVERARTYYYDVAGCDVETSTSEETAPVCRLAKARKRLDAQPLVDWE